MELLAPRSVPKSMTALTRSAAPGAGTPKTCGVITSVTRKRNEVRKDSLLHMVILL